MDDSDKCQEDTRQLLPTSNEIKHIVCNNMSSFTIGLASYHRSRDI